MGRAVALVVAVIAGVALTGCAADQEPALDVGDCIMLTGETADQDQRQYPVVDCAERHDAEVFAVFDFAWDPPYDDQAMSDQIDTVCLPLFEAFVGIGYWDSYLDFHSILPSAESWETGLREVACVLYEVDYETLTLVPLKGSERGSAR